MSLSYTNITLFFVFLHSILVNAQLSDYISHKIINNQLQIDISTSLAPWKSLDIVQSNNNLNLKWKSKNSSFFTCTSSNKCKKITNFLDFSDDNDIAVAFDDINFPNSYQSDLKKLRYLSPELISSSDNNYNASFLVIIKYDNLTIPNDNLLELDNDVESSVLSSHIVYEQIDVQFM